MSLFKRLQWVRLRIRHMINNPQQVVLLTMGGHEQAFWTVRSIAAKGGLTRNEVRRIVPGLTKRGLVDMTWLHEEHEPAYRVAEEGHRWLMAAP